MLAAKTAAVVRNLQPAGASILLGKRVEYEVVNVFDPTYTMVCKLRRSWLPAHHAT